MMMSIALILYVLSGKFLKALGQDEEVADLAYLYILCSFPGIFLMGMHDLQRKFLIEVGKSHL